MTIWLWIALYSCQTYLYKRHDGSCYNATLGTLYDRERAENTKSLLYRPTSIIVSTLSFIKATCVA